MNDNFSEEQEMEERPSRGFSLDSVYYVLFKRKWIIISFLFVSICSALAILFLLRPQQFHSEAQLFIRYVVESRGPTVSSAEPAPRMLNMEDESIILTEIDIIRSMDLVRSVVEAVGAERVLAKVRGGTNLNEATAHVRGNLTIEPLARRSVLSLVYRHPDPEITQEILNRLITAYVEKHRLMRNPAGLEAFYTNETTRLSEELTLTEQRLKEARAKAGVSSIEDARKVFMDQIGGLREELIKTKADLASYQSIVASGAPPTQGSQPATNSVAPLPPSAVRSEYKRVCDRLDQLTAKLNELLLTYLEETQIVKSARAEIEKEKQLRANLEQEHPGLVALAAVAAQSPGQPLSPTDPATAAIQVRALNSKIKELESQMEGIRKDLATAEAMEGEIAGLERHRVAVEEELKRFSASVDQRRIDAALGAGSALNIALIQSPTQPKRAWSRSLGKKTGMVSGGIAAFGFALAFALEFVLDRSIKRPVDIENKLRMPLLISIPELGRNGHRKKGRGRAKDLPRVDVDDEPIMPTDHNDPPAPGPMALTVRDREINLRRFCEGLRDRVVIDFDIRNLPHKTKLVAVTSCHRGAGVSTIAKGLAAALSESARGHSLLVDLNDKEGRSKRFFKGKLNTAPEERLEREAKPPEQSEGSFYGSDEHASKDRLPSLLPRSFSNLMPNIKAGDYDYIVFDMPPVSQTSMTARMAGIMDTVLLIIESEKTQQEAVEQANAILLKSKANVTTVLNKVRTYVPTRLYQDFLGDI